MTTDNLQADAMVRATQIATGALKSKWYDEGRKLWEFRISDHRKAIGDYIREHPEVVERATRDVERFAKFKSGAQKRNR